MKTPPPHTPMVEESMVKVHIDLPNHWGTGGEALWARSLGDDRYQIDNVPFFAYDLNFRDIVEAVADAPDLKPSVRRVLERSGHRTMRVMFSDKVALEERLRLLHSLAPLHVSFENNNSSHFALDLELAADMTKVRKQLDRWLAAEILDYETCEARVPGSFDDVPEEEGQ